MIQIRDIRHGWLRWGLVLVLLGGVFFWAGAALASGAAEGTQAHAGAGHDNAGHHDGGHGTKGWVATDTYRVMNFAVLAIGLFFILRKPASQALGARIDGIREELTDLETRKVQAEKELEKNNRHLSTLEEQARKLVEGYIKQGQEAKKRILAEAEKSARKLSVQGERNIENEFKNARLTLQDQIVEKAIEKAEMLVKDRINDADQERLVDEYLTKVVA